MDIFEGPLSSIESVKHSVHLTRRGDKFKDDTLGEQWLNAKTDEERAKIEAKARWQLTPEVPAKRRVKYVRKCPARGKYVRNRTAQCKHCSVSFRCRRAQMFCSTKCRAAGFIRLADPQRRLSYNVEDILSATGSLSDIAVRFGMSKSNAQRIRASNGVTRKPYVPDEKTQAILAATGTVRSIAAKFGVAPSTVCKIKKKGPDPLRSSPP